MSLTSEARSSSDALASTEPVSPAKSDRADPRIVSLDIVKGLMLIVSVGVDIWFGVPAWFDHVAWIGVHPMDWIFPTFVTLSGCGLAFANARRVRPWPAARRVVILLSVGLVYNYVIVSGAPFHVSDLRLPGVLQLYAGVVIVLVLLHTVVKGWRQWALVTVVLALLDTAVEWGWSVHCVGGALTPTCNPSHWIDYAIFGANHLYRNGSVGYDPEGLISIVGAVVTACLGAMWATHSWNLARAVVSERPFCRLGRSSSVPWRWLPCSTCSSRRSRSSGHPLSPSSSGPALPLFSSWPTSRWMQVRAAVTYRPPLAGPGH